MSDVKREKAIELIIMEERRRLTGMSDESLAIELPRRTLGKYLLDSTLPPLPEPIGITREQAIERIVDNEARWRDDVDGVEWIAETLVCGFRGLNDYTNEELQARLDEYPEYPRDIIVGQDGGDDRPCRHHRREEWEKNQK